MTVLFALATLAYLLVGLYVAVMGPFRSPARRYMKVVEHARTPREFLGPGGPLIRSATRPLEVVEYAHSLRTTFAPGLRKLFLSLPLPWVTGITRVAIGAAVIIGWPVFLLVAYVKWVKRNAELRSIVALRQSLPGGERHPLGFDRLGGCDRLQCHACDHSEGQTSHLHGFGADDAQLSGYQCTSCHQFHGVRSTRAGPCRPVGRPVLQRRHSPDRRPDRPGRH